MAQIGFNRLSLMAVICCDRNDGPLIQLVNLPQVVGEDTYLNPAELRVLSQAFLDAARDIESYVAHDDAMEDRSREYELIVR